MEILIREFENIGGMRWDVSEAFSGVSVSLMAGDDGEGWTWIVGEHHYEQPMDG